MSLQKEKLQFEWQRATNHFMLYVTFLIALTSFLFVSPPQFKIYLIWSIVVVTILIGMTLMILYIKEYDYGYVALRDKRKNKKIGDYLVWFIYLINTIIGVYIIAIGAGLAITLWFFP